MTEYALKKDQNSYSLVRRVTLGTARNCKCLLKNNLYRARQDSNLQPSDSKSADVKSQHTTDKILTDSNQTVLASCLALIVQKYPDLVQVVKAWPTLPEKIKTKIKGLIEKHSTGGKDNG